MALENSRLLPGVHQGSHVEEEGSHRKRRFERGGVPDLTLSQFSA